LLARIYLPRNLTAKAWAGVANCYSDEFFFLDPDPDILQKCKDAIDKAFEIDRNLPEAHLAMGNYYYGLRKFDKALRYYNTAVRLQPKNSFALFWTALLYRRTREWKKAISLMQEAIKIDPSRSDIYAEIANACSIIRDYPRSEIYSGKAISLQPDNNDFPSVYSYMIIKWKGDINAANKVIENYQRGFSK
jgi:tetratricopeptide (TPR) repeat protein